MTKKQRATHISNLIDIVENKGFTIDTWGNYKILAGGNTYRIKFMKNNIRMEKKISCGWYKVFSVNISKLDIDTLKRLLDNIR